MQRLADEVSDVGLAVRAGYSLEHEVARDLPGMSGALVAGAAATVELLRAYGRGPVFMDDEESWTFLVWQVPPKAVQPDPTP